MLVITQHYQSALFNYRYPMTSLKSSIATQVEPCGSHVAFPPESSRTLSDPVHCASSFLRIATLLPEMASQIVTIW